MNKCLPAAGKAKLGNRLDEMEEYGVLAHSYANAHVAKTYTAADIPITSIVRITLTLADAAADLILPALTNKIYIINNTSGQTITVKCADQTGTALANNGKYICWSNGTDIVTGVPEVTLAGAQTLINKTMTSPVLTTPKIADGDAGLTVTSANQTNAGATATVPNIGDAADEFLMKDTAQTATNKTFTSPVLNTPVVASPDITFHSVAHDYAGAAEDWTLSASELKAFILKPTNANGAVDAIVADTANKIYVAVNGTGQALTVTTAAGTGIEIANAKSAIVMSDGTNVIRLTPDA